MNALLEEAIRLDTIDEALADIRAGKMIIVVDDEDRENEGDFLIPAQHATPEVVNFMAKEGRGLICTPITEERARQLRLDPMVADNTDRHGTAFTVSVDLKGHGNTTGISAHDRSRTILALIDPATRPDDLSRPGHIFPLIAKENGVLRRTGHTEAAIDFARLAGCEPAGVIVEIMNEDGSMARLPELRQIADRHGLKLVSIEALVRYRLQRESLIRREMDVPIETHFGTFRFIVYASHNGNETQYHLALTHGEWTESEPVRVRMNASTFSGDLFTSFLTHRNNALRPVLEQIAEAGSGVIIYMNQNHPAGGLLQNLQSFQLQQQGLTKPELLNQLGIRKDERDFGLGAQILRDLGIRKMSLFSNHPKPRVALDGFGLEIVEVLPIGSPE